MAVSPEHGREGTAGAAASWRTLAGWTLGLFLLRLVLTVSDGSIICGPDSTWDKTVTVVFDVMTFGIVVLICRPRAPSRVALWLVPLAGLAVYELLRNPCVRPF
jgi:hypothetical protein